MQLLFMQTPNMKSVTVKDLSNYTQLIEKNHLLRRNYHKDKQYAGNKSEKYCLIKSLIDKKYAKKRKKEKNEALTRGRD